VGSGIIYAVIAVIWIAYFVPTWLRRHDEVSESRSVARYKSAMRVVARGTGAEIIPSTSERAEARATMLRRRQRSFAGIIGLLLLTVGSSMFELVSPWVTALPLVSGAVYVASVRRAKVAEDLLARRQAVRATRRANRDVTVQPSTFSFARTIQDSAVESVSIPSSVTIIERQDTSWQPGQIPVPTYVTAPKAVRGHRVIDLTKPGAWTAEQQAAEDVRLAAIAPSRDEVFDQVAADAAATEISARAANQ